MRFAVATHSAVADLRLFSVQIYSPPGVITPELHKCLTANSAHRNSAHRNSDLLRVHYRVYSPAPIDPPPAVCQACPALRPDHCRTTSALRPDHCLLVQTRSSLVVLHPDHCQALVPRARMDPGLAAMTGSKTVITRNTVCPKNTRWSTMREIYTP
jgi:hypothetical protein